MRGGLRDETKAWPNLQLCEPRRLAGSQQNASSGADTRRQLNLPETVTDTDMFNLIVVNSGNGNLRTLRSAASWSNRVRRHLMRNAEPPAQAFGLAVPVFP